MQVAGTRALVTGGASGLGGATARELAAGGAKVAILDLPNSAGAALAAEVGGVFVAADVRMPDDVEAAVDHAAEALGGLSLSLPKTKSDSIDGEVRPGRR